ncbi:MAG: zf-HC2 domain-containing protein [Nitrospirales bacterium]|nr:zf-HC2 domain-containing protein [Nitrospirales bacterium]
MDYSVGKMRCREVAEGITEFLEGGLSWKDALRFRLHLWLCLGCRKLLRQMQLTIQILQQLPRTPIPLNHREVLLQHFRLSKRWSSVTGTIKGRPSHPF